MSRGVSHLPPVRHVSLSERSVCARVCVSVESRVRAERVQRAIVRGYFQAHGERNYQRRFSFPVAFWDIFLPILGLVGVQQGFARLLFLGVP